MTVEHSPNIDVIVLLDVKDQVGVALERPLKRYPYLVFYIEQDDHIDVWRVLHSHRDIPSWLRDE